MAQLQRHGIGHVRDLGGMVFPWTCNSAGAMKRLIDAGVTGIVSDFPNRFSEVKAAL
jgi:glycerophosphoryl diester phosphodiesterase